MAEMVIRCMLQSPSPTHSSAAGTGGTVDDTLCLFAEQIAAVTQ